MNIDETNEQDETCITGKQQSFDYSLKMNKTIQSNDRVEALNHKTR